MLDWQTRGYGKKLKHLNKLIIAAIIVGAYFLNKYQHTGAIQSAVDSMVNRDAGTGVPLFWLDYRMLVMGGLVVALLVYYKSVWLSYKHLIRIHRNSVADSRKPPMSPLQAGYHYQQDKTRCVITWLIGLCGQGALSLRYKKGAYPWSVCRGSVSAQNDLDQQLVKTLFQEDNRIRLKASFHKPNPHVKKVADRFYKHLESENSHCFLAKNGSRPAWFLFAALIVEVLFSTDVPGSEIPMVIIATLLSSLFVAVVAYFFNNMLPSLLSGPRSTAIITISGASIVALLAHFMLFVLPDFKVGYLTTALYPSLLAAMGVLVKFSPLMPRKASSLAQIIGFKKYLSQKSHQVKEEDLPWTLGLGVHADIVESSFRYDGQTTPEWMKSKEDDLQALMKSLHQTLYIHLNEAIFGELKIKSRLGAGDKGMKY